MSWSWMESMHKLKGNSKECDAGCHIKQTEPHIQSSNMGEGAMRELKRA
jgi:hypothetical protein